MNINSKTQQWMKIQNIIFYVLVIVVIVLVAQFSLKTNVHMDWTANSRNSLSNTTKTFLAQLDKPITIQAFVSENNEFKPSLNTLLNRYLEHNKNLIIHYVDPDFSPDLVRTLKIQQQGEMVVSFEGRQQHVFDLSEQSLTNALIAVSRQKQQWLVFIEGHGERTPLHQANFNLSTWGETLKKKGLSLQSLNLIKHGDIPSNTAAIVIASPETPWLKGEVAIIKNYISDGGNLLWLADPDNHHYLSTLAEQLGINFIPGTVIDPNTESLGISDPRFVLITDYADHPISKATTSATLFPQATAIEQTTNNDWQYLPLLTTAANVWNDSQANSAILSTPSNTVFDEGVDTMGPLNLAYLLTRTSNIGNQDKEQRIAVIGDSDFLSNSFIGNASNLELGLALANWLVQDDDLISIPVKTTIDNQLELSQSESLIIGLGFLAVLPILLLSIGLMIWWQRRKQ